ncbi:MAG: NUDIX domain-containing protein [bacterium]|nr:NUDIX domain-containing protein [bacterium]
MQKNIDIHKAAGILIKDRKFLITRAKKKCFFVSPGGKVDKNETVEDALIRELKEELDIDTKIANLKNFGVFYASAQGQENKYLKMDVFLVLKWEGEIMASSEVEEVVWTDSNIPSDIELGSIFLREVLPKLKSLDLID